MTDQSQHAFPLSPDAASEPSLTQEQAVLRKAVASALKRQPSRRPCLAPKRLWCPCQCPHSPTSSSRTTAWARPQALVGLHLRQPAILTRMARGPVPPGSAWPAWSGQRLRGEAADARGKGAKPRPGSSTALGLPLEHTALLRNSRDEPAGNRGVLSPLHSPSGA